MIKFAIFSRIRRRYFPIAGALLIGISGFAAPVVAQNPKDAPRAASAKKKPAAKRADVARFRARVDSVLSEAHAQKAFWGVLIVDGDNGETLFHLYDRRIFFLSLTQTNMS